MIINSYGLKGCDIISLTDFTKINGFPGDNGKSYEADVEFTLKFFPFPNAQKISAEAKNMLPAETETFASRHYAEVVAINEEMMKIFRERCPNLNKTIRMFARNGYIEYEKLSAGFEMKSNRGGLIKFVKGDDGWFLLQQTLDYKVPLYKPTSK